VRTIKLCCKFQERHIVCINENLSQVYINLASPLFDLRAPYQEIGRRSFYGLAARRHQDKVFRVKTDRRQIIVNNNFVEFQLGFLHGEGIAEYLLGGLVLVSRETYDIPGNGEDYLFHIMVHFEGQDTGLGATCFPKRQMLNIERAISDGLYQLIAIT
jgi:hypothetical protein